MPLFAQELTLPSETAAAAELGAQVDRLQSAQFGLVHRIPLSTSTIRIDGAGNTWVWRLEERNNVSYVLLGNIMFLNIFLAFTTTLPTAVTTIYVQIPDGYMPGSNELSDRWGTLVPAFAYDGTGLLTNVTAAVNNPGAAASKHVAPYVRFVRDSGNFTAGDSTLGVQLWFEVQPFDTDAT